MSKPEVVAIVRNNPKMLRIAQLTKAGKLLDDKEPLIRLTDHEAAIKADKARIKMLEADRRKCWEEFKVQGRAMDRAEKYHAEERNELLGRCERLKQEAQIHAMEARTANATISEIYRAVTGGTGEPGSWRGAEPVRECVGELLGLLREARDPVCEALNGASNERGEAMFRDVLARIDATLAKYGEQS